MADFPCPSERIAASALLLLSTTTMPSISRSIFDLVIEDGESIGEARKIRSCRGSLVSNDSKSSASSSWSSELSDVSTEAISARSTRIGDFAPRHHEMNLKVVRKTRSKVQQVSGSWKFSSGSVEGSSMATPSRSVSVSGAESSRLTTATTSSSADSWSAQSRLDGYARTGKDRVSAAAVAVSRRRDEATRKTAIGSAHIRRRAEGILKMLSEGRFSEVVIRQVLGDSPDTSKALRILLKLEKVKRSGTGGRIDPYIYMIAPNV